MEAIMRSEYSKVKSRPRVSIEPKCSTIDLAFDLLNSGFSLCAIESLTGFPIVDMKNALKSGGFSLYRAYISLGFDWRNNQNKWTMYKFTHGYY